MTPREKRDVAVDLAACVLALYQCVGRVLAEQPPRVGATEEQAKAAFAACSAQWKTLVGQAARDAVALAPAASVPTDGRSRIGLARQYAAQLGTAVSTDAAAALSVAMDTELARGQHPEVAWQRAVAGYGLVTAAMRTYLAAVTRRGKNLAAPLATAKLAAQRALLAQVDRIGNREATAWAQLPVPRTPIAKIVTLVKVFDPDELRDEGGRWTAGGRTKLRVKEKADAVDELLSETPVEAPVDRWAAAAAAAAADRYAPAPTDRWAAAAATADRWAPAPADRWAPAATAAPADRWAEAAAAASADRWAPAAAPAPNVRRLIYFIGAAEPNKTPAPAPAREAADDDYGLYVPMQGLHHYFYDHAMNNRGKFVTNAVNFQVVLEYLTDFHGRTDPIEMKESRSPWSVAVGIEGISDDDWQAALALAVPLWDEVGKNPLRAINALGPMERAVIAEHAGYRPRSEAGTKQLLIDNEYLRANGVQQGRDSDNAHIRYDMGLSDALADYVVWNNPRVMGPKGAALEDLLDDRGLRLPLDITALPEVLNLSSGLSPDDDGGDLRGTYRIDTTHYHSAIGEFDYAAPKGKIALRETHIEPE